MSVSRRLRFEILRRDNHACTYCGASSPEVKLTVDHVVPVALGGSDDPSNLTAACVDCNAGKSSVPADAPTVATVSENARRWAEAVKLAARDLEADRAYRERCYQAFDDFWTSYTYTYDGSEIERPTDWRTSIDQFMAAGLPKEQVFDAVEIAMRSKTSDTWRYFCGVIWRKVDQMRELATSYVDEVE